MREIVAGNTFGLILPGCFVGYPTVTSTRMAYFWLKTL
jgi:hypothetical protein